MRGVTEATLQAWEKESRDPALHETFVTLKCPACNSGRATIDDTSAECTHGCAAESITARLNLAVFDSAEPPPGTPRLTPALRTLELYFQDDLDDTPEPEWYLDDLLPKGETGIIYGAFGSRKSLIALDWGNRVALEHGLVIYVTPEGFRGVKKRWAAWRAYNYTPRVERLALVKHAVQLREPHDVEALQRAIATTAEQRGEPVALIIIDTLARSNAGGNENSSEDMTAWLASADQLRLAFGADCTLLVIHHVGNDPGRPRGSSSIEQWATFTLLAEAQPGDATRLTVKKAKDSEPIEVRYRQQLMLEQDSVVLVEEARGPRGERQTTTVAPRPARDKMRRDILELLADGEARKRPEVAQALGKVHSDQTLRGAWDELIEEGTLTSRADQAWGLA